MLFDWKWRGSDMEYIRFYIELLVIPIQMLYSQLNPIFFFIILKSQRQSVGKIVRKLQALLSIFSCYKMNVTGTSENLSNKSLNTPRKSSIFKLFFCCFVLIAVCLTTLRAPLEAERIEESTRDVSRLPQTIQMLKESKIKSSLGLFDDLTDTTDPRVTCMRKHGVMSLEFRRCYSVQVNQPELTFHQQIKAGMHIIHFFNT